MRTIRWGPTFAQGYGEACNGPYTAITAETDISESPSVAVLVAMSTRQAFDTNASTTIKKERAGRSYPSSAVLLSNNSNCLWRYFTPTVNVMPGPKARLMRNV